MPGFLTVSLWSVPPWDNRAMRTKASLWMGGLLLALPLANAIGQPSSTEAASPAPQISLANALASARQNLTVSIANRALAAARSDVRAADRDPLAQISAKIGQIDLQNGLGPGNPLTQKRIDKAIGIDWTWERGNKRALRTQAAQLALSAAQADLEDVQLQQLLATHAAYFDLLAGQERLTQIVAIASSAADLARTAALRVKAGDLAPQDAARTDIEAQRAQADVISAELDRQRAGLALAQLMGRSEAGSTAVSGAVSSPSDWPPAPAAPAQIAINGIANGDRAAALLSIDALSALAQSRPDVRAAQARVLAARALVDNATALKTADITIGSSLDHYPGTSTRLLELRAQMPLQGVLGGHNYEAEVDRALALLSQTQDALDRTRLAGLGELHRQQQELVASTQRVRSVDADIVPRARRVAELAEMAYAKGALSLTDLLDARRTLRNTLLEAISARADYARALGAWQLRTAPHTVPGALP